MTSVNAPHFCFVIRCTGLTQRAALQVLVQIEASSESCREESRFGELLHLIDDTPDFGPCNLSGCLCLPLNVRSVLARIGLLKYSED